MTEPRRPDDELVSAVLDGEATDEELARVQADPALGARLEEFAAVARAVGAPVEPVDAAGRDRTIARALADADTGDGADTVVTELDRPAGRRRADRARRVVLVAAAVFGLLALAGGLLTLGDGDDAQDRAAGTADQDAGTAAGDVDVPELELGSIDDPETLRTRVNESTGLAGAAGSGAEAPAEAEDAPGTADPAPDDAFAPEARDDPAPTPSLEECAIQLVESRPQLIGQLAQGTLTYQDTAAFVLVYNDADLGRAVAIVTAAADCTVLAEVAL